MKGIKRRNSLTPGRPGYIPTCGSRRRDKRDASFSLSVSERLGIERQKPPELRVTNPDSRFYGMLRGLFFWEVR